MKTSTIYLTTTLLLTSAALVSGNSANATNNGLQLRYHDPAGMLKLSVLQDINVGEHDHIAERTFSLDLGLSTEHEGVAITINKAGSSYTAHGMKQRLPAKELTGQLFKLPRVDGGRSLQQLDADSGPVMGLGAMFEQGYSIGLALVDILPVLPEDPVTVGSSWTTQQTTQSIEGWAWASGPISNLHTVTAIEQNNGHSIASVTTTSSGQLGAVEGGRAYSGDGTLTRTSNWRFDASDGRLLSLSMEQETNGINTLPQGEVDVRQVTKVELTTQ